MLKVAWSESYVLPLPPNHRFPMSKYEVLPQQLLHEGTITPENLFRPEIVDTALILDVHAEEYWNRLISLTLSPKEIRRTGFPMSSEVVNPEINIVSGTVRCAVHALTHGISMNIAGGTHHAFTNKGEGFCLLNDIAIAARYMLKERLANRVLVVDLDVHQGNGTAEIFRDEPSVFTFSMHGANNYPLLKENSDLDIGLPDFTSDKFYLESLEHSLNYVLDTFQPDFIFYQSGVDILDTDKLGRLSVSREGCKLRDKFVLQCAKKNRIPLVASMGGGYSSDFRDIIEAHANTYRLAQEIFF
jgi:acetoin utilization deacetylase AcuC-like enzyme